MDFLKDNFKQLTTTPENVEQLKKIILQMAVQGKLTAKWRKENPDLEPASVLIAEIKAEKEKLVKGGEIKRQKLLPQLDEAAKPFELPRNWEFERLGNVGLINPRSYLEDDTNISFIDMKKISSNFFVQPKFEIRKWAQTKSGFTHFRNDDVAVAKITPCFENSKAAIFNNLENEYGAGTTELHIFRSIITNLIPSYIYIILKSPYFLYNGKHSMRGVAGQKRVPTDFFRNFIIPICPYNEQEVIVSKVKKLFNEIDELFKESKKKIDLREKSSKALFTKINTATDENELNKYWQILNKNFNTVTQSTESVKQLRQTILQLAIQGKLTAKWRKENPNEEPASVLLERIKAEKEQLIKEGKIKKQKPLPVITEDEKPFEIPESWEWCRLQDFAEIIMGQSPASETYNKKGFGLPFYQGKKEFGKVFLSKKSVWCVKPSRIAEKDDVLISVRAPVGDPNIATEKCGIGRGLSIVRPYLPTFTYYLFYFFTYNKPLWKTRGAFFDSINKEDIISLLIPIPTLSELDVIIAKIKELFFYSDELERQDDQKNVFLSRTMESIVNYLK